MRKRYMGGRSSKYYDNEVKEIECPMKQNQTRIFYKDLIEFGRIINLDSHYAMQWNDTLLMIKKK
jgi:hypothetical protein